MPLIASQPQDLFRLFKDHLDRLLHLTITQAPLTLVVAKSNLPEAEISFRRNGISFAVPIGQRGWHLYLWQKLRVQLHNSQYILKTFEYRYKLQQTADLNAEPEFRYEYVSPVSDPLLPYCRNHLHLHPKLNGIVSNLVVSQLHIPTGWVTIESLIRFLITELGVSALTPNWEQTLRDSERQFRVWAAPPI